MVTHLTLVLFTMESMVLTFVPSLEIIFQKLSVISAPFVWENSYILAPIVTMSTTFMDNLDSSHRSKILMFSYNETNFIRFAFFRKLRWSLDILVKYPGAVNTLWPKTCIELTWSDIRSFFIKEISIWMTLFGKNMFLFLDGERKTFSVVFQVRSNILSVQVFVPASRSNSQWRNSGNLWNHCSH